MSVVAGHVVRLPAGWVDPAGGWHRDAVVVPLTGREEELLASSSEPTARLVTRVLARCVVRVGDIPMTELIARELTVGDRQALLLRLREVTFGPVVTAVLRCPWPGCGARMDLDFSTRDVPVREARSSDRVHELLLSEQAAGTADVDARRVRFRLPDGSDQEAVGDRGDPNPAAACGMLLARCVVELGPAAPPTPEQVEQLSPLARLEIERAMAERAAGPQLSLEADCPECSRCFVLPFDVQDFFFGELRASPELLLREIHYLAYHYHWGEAEILDMTRDRRQRYIEVLAEEIERIDDAVG